MRHGSFLVESLASEVGRAALDEVVAHPSRIQRVRATATSNGGDQLSPTLRNSADDIAQDANFLFGRMLQGAPRLVCRVHPPDSWFDGTPVEWRAIDAAGNELVVSDLSAAQMKWACLSIALAMRQNRRDGEMSILGESVAGATRAFREQFDALRTQVRSEAEHQRETLKADLRNSQLEAEKRQREILNERMKDPKFREYLGVPTDTEDGHDWDVDDDSTDGDRYRYNDVDGGSDEIRWSDETEALDPRGGDWAQDYFYDTDDDLDEEFDEDELESEVDEIVEHMVDDRLSERVWELYFGQGFQMPSSIVHALTDNEESVVDVETAKFPGSFSPTPARIAGR